MSCCLVLAVPPLARAEPEFFTKAAVGGTAPAVVPFTITFGVFFNEGHATKVKWECKKGRGSGEVTGTASAANVSLDLQECEIATESLPCENKGGGTKEIETKPLSGELGGLSETKPGLRLRPATGEAFTEFECGGGAVLEKWKGSVVGELTGASGKTVEEGTIGSSFELKYAETGGIQKYTKFLGETEGNQLEAVFQSGTEQHSELLGISVTHTVKSEPVDNLGFTE
jgi:hypothetical protein